MYEYEEAACLKERRVCFIYLVGGGSNVKVIRLSKALIGHILAPQDLVLVGRFDTKVIHFTEYSE